MKKISIIIPCHNSSGTLQRPWNSLKAQTMGLGQLECIFVDDASEDDGATWDMLSGIEQEAPESVVILRLTENLRQGGARNAGLQYVTGEYIMFLDADDMLSEDACEELYKKAKYYGAELIQFRHRFIRGDGSGVPLPPPEEITGELFYDLSVPELRTAFLIHAVGDYGCTNKFYSADLVRRTRSLFGERVVYEEPKFVYPMFLYAKNVLMTDGEYYLYFWHIGSTMTSETGKRLLDHPKVQMELLEDLMGRQEVYAKYKKEIEQQFIRSFFCETVQFSVRNRGTLPLGYFQHMQNICRKLFPERESNEYLQGTPIAVMLMPMLTMEFKMQEELDGFIQSAGLDELL